MFITGCEHYVDNRLCKGCVAQIYYEREYNY